MDPNGLLGPLLFMQIVFQTIEIYSYNECIARLRIISQVSKYNIERLTIPVTFSLVAQHLYLT